MTPSGRARAIVGRGDEVAALEGFLAATGGPSALVVEGEAGIGKTTIWREGVFRARGLPAKVLEATPSAWEATLSFASLADLLEPVLEEVLPGLPAPQRRGLESALLLEEDSEAPPDPRAVAVAFLRSLRALARDGPVVVAVDDFQWLDRSSQAVLLFALRRVGEDAVRFLLAERIEDGASSVIPPDVEAERLPVGPLSFGALHRILHEALGEVFPRPALRRLHEVSGGNPFYALELGRALRRGALDSAAPDALVVPPSLLDLVRERLDVLPGETLDALRLASALSRPTLHLVERARTGAAAALDAAAEAHVVEVAGDEIRFTHPVLAAGAYAAIPPGQRLELHARLAEIETDPEARARHLGLAQHEPDPGVAAEIETAARRARRRGAPATAAELAERAAELTPEDDAEARARRAGDAGRYRFEAGDTGGARALLEAALADAPAGPRRADILAVLGRVCLYEQDELRAADLFRQALRETGDDLALRSECEQALSTTYLFRREDLAAGTRHARRAVRLAEELGDDRALGVALSQLGVVEGLRGRVAAERAFERALALPPAAYQMTIQGPSYVYSDYLYRTDRFEEARDRLEAAHVEAREHGDESSLAVVLGDLGLLECVRGRWEEAERVLELGWHAAEQTAQRPWQAYVLGVRALVAAHRGDADRTDGDARRALELAGDGAMVAQMCARWALGLLALSRGDAETTVAELGPLVARLYAAGVEEPGDIRFVPDLVEALVRLGRAEEAAAALAPFERGAERLGRASALAASRRCRGLLAAAAGDADRALAALEESRRHAGRIAVPCDRARTLLELGAAQRRSRQRRRARETLGEALGLFGALGASLWAERTSEELARIGGRARQTALTRSEERVAALVATGRTNKEVAAELFVTERTVEYHLSNAFTKLGVRTRTELARRIAAGKD